MDRWNFQKVVDLCIKKRKCTKAVIAVSTGLSPSMVDRYWQLLRSSCSEGLLDTDKIRCIYRDNEIVFEEVK